MAIVVNGMIMFNGMNLGPVSQMKHEVKDGTIIDISYDRPNRLVIS